MIAIDVLPPKQHLHGSTPPTKPGTHDIPNKLMKGRDRIQDPSPGVLPICVVGPSVFVLTSCITLNHRCQRGEALRMCEVVCHSTAIQFRCLNQQDGGVVPNLPPTHCPLIHILLTVSRAHTVKLNCLYRVTSKLNGLYRVTSKGFGKPWESMDSSCWILPPDS